MSGQANSIPNGWLGTPNRLSSKTLCPNRASVIREQIDAGFKRGGATVVGLFANRSSTAWYRDYVVPSAMVVQLQGRLRFVHQGRIVTPGSMSEAPFPSILAIWPREAGDVLLHHCTPVSAVLLQLPE
jgi:hypothetical protein